MDNVEVMNSPDWTPEQALTQAMKTIGWKNVSIVGEFDEDGTTMISSITAGCDTKTLLLHAEVLRMRAMR
jgi:hypothetical protein